MWLIMGTSPQVPAGTLFHGKYTLGDNAIISPQGQSLRLERGIETLATAAALVCAHFDVETPHIICAGDKGKGDGSRAAYAYFAENIAHLQAEYSLNGVTFHYLFPDVDGHNKVLMGLQALPESQPRPILVADAGFMYAAKMSGYADYYDLFTPDLGEMAFLADELAPHPFYTRGFLLDTEHAVEDLLSRAVSHGNVAKNLIIKGSKDYVVHGSEILATVTSPSTPSMEAIGGTGDLVTGITTGLLASGVSMHEACTIAIKTNRVLAQLAQPTPATQVHALTPYLQRALQEVMDLSS